MRRDRVREGWREGAEEKPRCVCVERGGAGFLEGGWVGIWVGWMEEG